jgi:hypothetical protein
MNNPPGIYIGYFVNELGEQVNSGFLLTIETQGRRF